MTETPNDSSTDEEAARLPDLLETRNYSKFVLHGKKEIVAVLRKLQTSVALTTAFFDSGREMILTTLLEVNDDTVVLETGSDSNTNRKALTFDKFYCVASQEKVRIQFELGRLTQVTFDGRPAFRAALPDSVLRLQRRDFFRLSMPITRPLRCSISRTDESGNTSCIDTNMVDISGGGLALTVPKGMALEVGMEFQNCSIDLPEVGTIKVALVVRNVFEVELRSGARVTRAGCAFVKPSGATMALIQRYIMKVERERKARESGLL